MPCMPAFARICVSIVLAGFAAVAPAGEASTGRVLLQPPPDVIASPINDRFAVRVLYYYPTVDNTLRYDSSGGVAGTLINVEDRLGHRSKVHQGTIDMMFRIGERHRIHADFYQLRRTGDEVIAGQIRFGDDVYDANDRLVSEMELRKM